MKVLLIGALPSSLVNFRGPLLRTMLANGLKVFAAANGRDAETEARLQAMGVEYCPIRIARAGMNPLADVVTLIDLVRLMRRVRPDLVLSYTIKPVIWGGMAARIAGVPAIHSLVTGLGYAFMDAAAPRQRLAGKLAKGLYRLSLRNSLRVFFQNPDDSRAFVEMGLVSPDKVVVVNGSGVDLDHFSTVKRPSLAPCRDGLSVRFLLIARLLRDKGIVEYADAARKMKQSGCRAEFHLVGPFDPNPSGLSRAAVEAWTKDRTVEYHGEQEDVRPFLRECDVYVLPSYREGTPRTVLEAMASGRAIITTDAPGCRETVRGRAEGGNLKPEENRWQRTEDRGQGTEDSRLRPNLGEKRDYGGQGGQTTEADGWIRRGKLKIGANGILVPLRDAEALAEAMEYFIKNPDEIARMGAESRRYAEERYDVHKVNAVMMREMGLVATT